MGRGRRGRGGATPGDGREFDHAHAVPLFRAEAIAHGKEVQVLASETGKTDIDALRKVQAVSDGVIVHGTGKAFEATGENVKTTISERTDLAQKAAEAVRSLGLPHDHVSVEHTERTPDAMKALGNAYVESTAGREQKMVVAARVTGVHQANRAVREAQLIDATDVNVPVPRSPNDPVTGKTQILPVAGGDRLQLRAATGAKALNLTAPLHDPAAARFEVKSIERTPEGGATAQLRIDSPNPQDNDRWITAAALARMTHAYAGTFSQVAAGERRGVFALVTGKDSPEKVREALAAGRKGTIVGKTSDVRDFAGRIEAAQRQAADALEKVGRVQERTGQERGGAHDRMQAAQQRT